MKLHTKLTLSLLTCLIVFGALLQAIQYYSVTALVTNLSEANMRLLKSREEKNSMNICRSVGRAVAGSIERGEMEKFSELIKAQNEVEGLLEFSLYGHNGIVSHSSDASFLEKQLPDNIKKQIQAEPEQILLYTDHTIEIYQPQKIKTDCLRCHTDWNPDGLGGITHFRFSTDFLTEAENQTAATISGLKKTFLRNFLFSSLGIILLVMLVMHRLLNIFVRQPLDQFVQLLTWYQEGEGDLTRHIHIKAKDEVGLLGKLFNAFIVNLNKIIAHAQKAAVEVGKGANEQVKQMENISASVVETAIATRENADKARDVKALMKGVSDEIARANDAMDALTDAMNQLSHASDKMAKIINVIDEIAFQTNLLGLNAAVEAARAGESGVGFAVVANEIRRLAMRSADEAKNTSRLIKDTVKKIEDSSKIVSTTSDIFLMVTGKVEKAKQLVEDISLSSQDQAEWAESMGRALAEVGNTAHKNADRGEKLRVMMSIFKTDYRQIGKNL